MYLYFKLNEIFFKTVFPYENQAKVYSRISLSLALSFSLLYF